MGALSRMNFRRRQLLGWAILLAAAALGGLWLLQLDFSRKVSTDVLDLVPERGLSPELALVRQLAGEAEARTVLIELTVAGNPAPSAAAEPFAAALRQSGAFDQAVAMADASARDAVARELFAQRLPLLFPRWLHARMKAHAGDGSMGDPADWLARDAAAALGKFVESPEAVAFQDLVPSDPLLLLPGVVEQFKGGAGLVSPPAGAGSPTLVWARLAASPFSEAGQGPAFAALTQATAGLQEKFPGLHAADAGVNRFAAASRARIEHEVTWLNALSLAAVLAVAFTCIRQFHRGLHLVPVVLMSVLGAWVCTTLVFARVPVLVFVFGSLLTGVAIDYGFYLFMQPPAGPGEDYFAKVRRLLKPLLASCLTTVAGFALLLFSDLPFIRQLGVFVGSGLLSALAAAIVYFATVREPFLPARTFRRGALVSAEGRRRLRYALVGLWVIALPGLLRLYWKDDIRELEIPSPELKREDARIRALFGEQGGGTVYVTYGTDLADARASLEKLQKWLATAEHTPAPRAAPLDRGDSGQTVQAVSLAPVIPTAEEAKDAATFVRERPEFPAKLRAALEAAGFDGGEFGAFFADYATYAADPALGDPAAALRALQRKLAGPLGLLMREGRPLSWFVTLATNAPAEAPPADTHTVSASQLQSLNQVFARYRISALKLSAVGLAIVGFGVLLSYGWRDGLRIFAIPCGACLGLFGMLGWLGVPLNLFHLLGAFLGVCLTHNYSIFSATSAYRHEPPPVSVRVSALTAAASFGVLALSGIPVVRALGLTVSLMVLAALLVIEFEHLSGLGRKT